MANGDIAVAEAGFVAVKNTDDFRLGYDRINEVADLAVRRGLRSFATYAAMIQVAGKFIGDLATVVGTASTYRWMVAPGASAASWLLWDRGNIGSGDFVDPANGAGFDTSGGIFEANMMSGVLVWHYNLYRAAGIAGGTNYATLKAGWRPSNTIVSTCGTYGAATGIGLAQLDSGGNLAILLTTASGQVNSIRGFMEFRVAQGSVAI